MRSAIIIAAVASLTIGAAFAQPANAPAASDPGKTALPRIDLTLEPGNPAIKTTGGNNPGAPLAGANSFTEAQAKSHIEAKCYSNVSALKKDGTGIWRATAIKNGQADKNGLPVNVSLDYQGNVVAN
jgi:hypothetical protein